MWLNFQSFEELFEKFLRNPLKSSNKKNSNFNGKLFYKSRIKLFQELVPEA
jgi:hypothetical protein